MIFRLHVIKQDFKIVKFFITTHTLQQVHLTANVINQLEGVAMYEKKNQWYSVTKIVLTYSEKKLF